jgi:DNA invertase Pin-like site-specific DNA recombinase
VTTLGYVRVSTGEQGESGLGLEAQRAAVLRVHPDAEIVAEVGSGRTVEGRPALAGLLARLEPGDVLVVAKLDRLSRSVADFAGLLGRSRRDGWRLVALDLGVDTGTAAGELVATVLAAVAAWEVRTISDRTIAALAVARAAGVRLGRPLDMSPDVRASIRAARLTGQAWDSIARDLEAAGVPTARAGSTWRGSTCRRAAGVTGS